MSGECPWRSMTGPQIHISEHRSSFSNCHSVLPWITHTQDMLTCRILKIHKWIWGDVSDGPHMFLLCMTKWHIDMIEWHTPANLHSTSWGCTQTHEIITCRASIMHSRGYAGCYLWVGESFFRNDKWQIKLFREDFSQMVEIWTWDKWLKLKQ